MKATLSRLIKGWIQCAWTDVDFKPQTINPSFLGEEAGATRKKALLESSKLINFFLLRCGTRPYVWSPQWDLWRLANHNTTGVVPWNPLALIKNLCRQLTQTKNKSTLKSNWWWANYSNWWNKYLFHYLILFLPSLNFV